MSQELLLVQRTPLLHHAKIFLEKHWLISCLAIIISVSIYDTYLVYVFRDLIQITERNPICLALIDLEPTYLTCFFIGKMLGNVCVVSVLIALCCFGHRHHKTIVMSVAAFQLFLWLYLTVADQKTGILSFDGLLHHNAAAFTKAVCSLLIHVAVLAIVALVIWRQHRRSNWEIRQQAA